VTRLLAPLALLGALVVACGGPAAAPETAPRAGTAGTDATAAPPYPPTVALPPAPDAVVTADLGALRETPLYREVREEMASEGPNRFLGVFFDATARFTLASYEALDTLVIIGRGDYAAGLEALGASDIEPRERLGVTTYGLAPNLVLLALSEDTVVACYPSQVEELVRVAVGRSPAYPLPPAMREAEGREGFEGAAFTVRIRSAAELGGGGGDAFRETLRQSELVALAGHIEGEALAVTGHVRLPTRVQAERRATALRAALRGLGTDDVAEDRLRTAVQQARVETDGPYVVLHLDLAVGDLPAFLRLVGPLVPR
jgi:hypothetical protein